MPQWCENKKRWQWWRGGQSEFFVALLSLLPLKNTSTLLFRARQPLFLISSSISSIGLTVCSGLWTNSPFYSTSLLPDLMAGTAQRRVNYCIAHGWHTAPWLHQFKKHECVTRRAIVWRMWWTRVCGATVCVCTKRGEKDIGRLYPITWFAHELI